MFGRVIETMSSGKIEDLPRVHNKQLANLER
jgi:hypothetical protein